ncbi:BTB/POZ domain-containing protein KCTD21-like [Pristis pectinata]|uniref:BTB/POZ domain-containing protein KCTD21-like n=1 Tax=Pristis pectinata TaxID=685728 RepID=UPI00223D554B|nr:BTB/POZ domain-containing protein KCTD21-like [Pristis pectinata]XP_051900806.1 BTB/POZ domain-containing protein KCTD21-like [Pristis pectinata]
MQRSPSLEPVSLNVGGTVYTTNGETLSRFPDSMLGAMFRGQLPSSRDQAGNLFIDRDGKPFRHILNYLRSSHLDLPEDYKEMRLLQREADFYQIQPLLKDLCSHSQGLGHALLQCNLLSHCQTLHFTLKEGPLHYALSSCPITTYRAQIFCTCSSTLDLLRQGLELSPEPGEGEVSPGHRLRLEWTPRPEGLPPAEYAKQGFRRLLSRPGGLQLADGQALVEEVLKVALSRGFRLDAAFPEPSDVLGCTALRFVRY